MFSLVGVLPLLSNVAKVDIRAAGTLTSEAILENLLKVAYVGAGLSVEPEHMTVMHAAVVGASPPPSCLFPARSSAPVGHA